MIGNDSVSLTMPTSEICITPEEKKHSEDGFINCLSIWINDSVYLLRMVDKRMIEYNGTLYYYGYIYTENGDVYNHNSK